MLELDRPKAGMQLCMPGYEFSYFLNAYEVVEKKPWVEIKQQMHNM